MALYLGGRPAIYSIDIPYISLVYSMYIYKYIHILRAARNVNNPPANNYVARGCNFVYAAGGCAGAGSGGGTGALPALALAVLSCEVAFVLALFYMVLCCAC